MPALRPFTESEYAAWMAEAIPGFAADKVASGQWSQAESLELARKEHEALLPQGLATAGNHFLAILDQDAAVVGTLWFASKSRGDERIAYVYDIGIAPGRQREGHAYHAFRALEEEVRKMGLAGIALHVFGHNAAAQALYAKLGFRPTNISLYKPVDAAFE